MTHEMLIALGFCGSYSSPSSCSFVFIFFYLYCCYVGFLIVIFLVILIQYLVSHVQLVSPVWGSTTYIILSVYLVKYDRFTHSFYNDHASFIVFYACKHILISPLSSTIRSVQIPCSVVTFANKSYFMLTIYFYCCSLNSGVLM